MSEIKDGGPAFGQVVSLRCVRVEMNGDIEWEPEAMTLGGLSVRDYFAAKVLAALIGYPNKNGENCGAKAVPKLAGWAYEYADAMLRARQA